MKVFAGFNTTLQNRHFLGLIPPESARKLALDTGDLRAPYYSRTTPCESRSRGADRQFEGASGVLSSNGTHPRATKPSSIVADAPAKGAAPLCRSFLP